jgi:hypothetical protein
MTLHHSFVHAMIHHGMFVVPVIVDDRGVVNHRHIPFPRQAMAPDFVMVEMTERNTGKMVVPESPTKIQRDVDTLITETEAGIPHSFRGQRSPATIAV